MKSRPDRGAQDESIIITMIIITNLMSIYGVNLPGIPIISQSYNIPVTFFEELKSTNKSVPDA